MRREEDYQEFRMSLRVLGASYEQFIGDEHVAYYWSVLEDLPFDVVATCFDQLTRAEHGVEGKLPSAHALHRAIEADGHGHGYEVWCQHAGCRGRLAWPCDRHDEGRFFCPRHQPDHGRPATIEERQALLAQATPEAKAFLRTALPALMADIAITSIERKAAEEQAMLHRPRAFERTAEGPGVNPGVFLSHPFLTEGLPSDYAERRQIVAGAGWKFDQAHARWQRGKRTMSDDTIDRFPSHELLAEYVGRRTGSPSTEETQP